MNDSTSSFDAAKVARELLRRGRQGALATLMPDSGAPYCSLVNVASHPDGSPILLISRLARHTQNIAGDARVSLLLDDRAGGDALQGSRVMLAGSARLVEGDEVDLVRRRYLAAHPSAEMFVDFPDFAFRRIMLQDVHLVAGFGRIVDLDPGQVLTDLSGAAALVAAEQDAVDHLNQDHADTLGLYAERLLGAGPAAWRCTGCDPAGLDLAHDGVALRLDFPRRVTTPGDLRAVLVGMAERARGGGATPS